MLDYLLVRYLRWRGWVVFRLDPRTRVCEAGQDRPLMDCWLALYLGSDWPYRDHAGQKDEGGGL